ncbi:MAG: HAMP domain-containing protein, partial [Caulobacteraceae bacterium]|nr:HAMP domain-containing protein [Caulobacter sp.]
PGAPGGLAPPIVRAPPSTAAAGVMGGPPVSGAVIGGALAAEAPRAERREAAHAPAVNPQPVTSPVLPAAAAEAKPATPAPAPDAATTAADPEGAAGLGVIAPAPLVAARSGETGGYIVHAPALQPRGLFGLAPAPFVQGDFVAALRAGGRWAVVQPRPEPFPNSWQRRVALWFAVALLIVGPLAWLFARRLARPLDAFARAAERLGRDPSGEAVALSGPAEIGRAARAFTTMQQRLKRFVDDRTAMVGAISHDLRTPLARMRFRMERAAPDLKRPMLHDIAQMEEMISSVLVFIREASEPSVRERVDLRSILECVVDDAALLGGDAALEGGQPLSVEVDALGVQRVLANLVDNALKYGARAAVRLYVEGGDAVAEVADAGPGLPAEELERVFQPFYRAEASRTLNAGGIGLGLAVSRSIARSHGGDVRLKPGDAEGVVAQLRLPLAAPA